MTHPFIAETIVALRERVRGHVEATAGTNQFTSWKSIEDEVRQALTDAFTAGREAGYTKAIEDALDAIPLRSDWDDDVKVTAQMVINTTREAISSYLPLHKQTIDPLHPYQRN